MKFHSCQILYIGAIFWTLGYDTIYGIQDISYYEVIGVKSTSIKFQENLGLFIGGCYLISTILIVIVMMNLKINFTLIFILLFIFSLFYQIKISNTKNPAKCLKAFKLNNLSGFIIFISFLFLSVEV